MINIVLIFVLSYMVLFLEKLATINVGESRSAFCSIDLCKERKLYAPFKYRPLGFWLARLFGITSRGMDVILARTDRFSYRVLMLNPVGLEKYYIFKYALLVLANLVFYWYLSALGLPTLAGVAILNLFISLTFIYDNFDSLLEIILYGLLLIGMILHFHFALLFVIALMGGLNRESSIFMIPIAFFYSPLPSFGAVALGFLIGFTIPRIMYREAVDIVDSGYSSPFKFLVFNPIRNWTNSIWPHLKTRFTGKKDAFRFEYRGTIGSPTINGGPFVSHIKDWFLNRIFLGVAMLLFFFVLFFFGFDKVPPFFHNLTFIFSAFIVLISIPADIREIKVYCPAFYILVPYILYLS